MKIGDFHCSSLVSQDLDKKTETCYASAFLFAIISVIKFFTLRVHQVPQEPVVQDYPVSDLE
jgi:hypothetical protein